jgi:hypothetical protein
LQEKPTGKREEKMRGQWERWCGYCLEYSWLKEEENQECVWAVVEKVLPVTSFVFPLRLVLGVSCFVAELIFFWGKSRMQRRSEESEGFGRRFQRELVLLECTYFAI